MGSAVDRIGAQRLIDRTLTSNSSVLDLQSSHPLFPNFYGEGFSIT
jgi:hypothetical protein